MVRGAVVAGVVPGHTTLSFRCSHARCRLRCRRPRRRRRRRLHTLGDSCCHLLALSQIVGFYTTGNAIRANDIHLEALFRQHCGAAPVMAIIDVDQRGEGCVVAGGAGALVSSFLFYVSLYLSISISIYIYIYLYLYLYLYLSLPFDRLYLSISISSF